MKASEILRAAKARISTPDRWTQGASARNAFGLHVTPFSEHATCYCGYGAIWSIKNHGVLRHESSETYLSLSVGRHFPYYNDEPGRTHEEVMAAFDKAIQLAEEAGE